VKLSYVIISHNRKPTLLKTIERLQAVTPLPRTQWETWVVDNASTDGSADAVQQKFPHVHLLRNKTNQGMYARNHAFAKCSGKYVISLDDDSYPADQRSVNLMLSHMDSNPSTGALVGRVILPDDSLEGPALPGILMGGASCLRKSVLDATGGFRKEFFRQAEEYDLSFRIWRGGWRVERCEQAVFEHEKVSGAGRPSPLVSALDLRNNLIIAQRFLPEKLRRIYWDDWRQRYTALARGKASSLEIFQALNSARIWSLRDQFSGRPELEESALENIFQFRRQAALIGDWARRNSVWRVVLGDFSKNIFAAYNAARGCGLQIRCIADDNPAFEDIEYRGLPIVETHKAFEGGGIDGVILTNINPAQIDARYQILNQIFPGPVLRLWRPPQEATQVEFNAKPEPRADAA
jgi:GT2 family glycosyltransferase